jgi:hypothetical protein
MIPIQIPSAVPNTTRPILIIALGGVAGALIVRYLVAYVNARGDNQARKAAGTTADWLGMVAGGIVAAGAAGIGTFGDIAGQIFALIGGNPFAISNLGAIGLGAANLGGLLSLSVEQYVGVALLLAGLVFVFSEVENQ